MLPRDGLDKGVEDFAKAARAKAHAKAEAAQAIRKRKKSAFDRKILPLAGMTVHLCKLLSDDARKQCQHQTRLLRLTEADRANAVFFICDNPAQPRSQYTKLAVAMSGGVVATPEWLVSGGHKCVAVSAIPAVEQAKRRLWVSESFSKQNPILGAIVRSSMAAMKSRWTPCSKDNYITDALKATPPWCTLALVTKREREALGVRTALDLVAFNNMFFRTDQSRSSMQA